MKCLKQAIPSNTFFSVVTFAGINVRRVLLTESMAERKHQKSYSRVAILCHIEISVWYGYCKTCLYANI